MGAPSPSGCGHSSPLRPPSTPPALGRRFDDAMRGPCRELSTRACSCATSVRPRARRSRGSPTPATVRVIGDTRAAASRLARFPRFTVAAGRVPTSGGGARHPPPSRRDRVRPLGQPAVCGAAELAAGLPRRRACRVPSETNGRPPPTRRSSGTGPVQGHRARATAAGSPWQTHGPPAVSRDAGWCGTSIAWRIGDRRSVLRGLPESA